MRSFSVNSLTSRTHSQNSFTSERSHN